MDNKSQPTKICSSCKQEQPVESFALRNSKRRHNRCKTCQAEYCKKHYQDNKSRYIARSKLSNKDLAQRNRDFVNSIKESFACFDCGSKYPACAMDFDHREGHTKEYNVSKMVAHSLGLDRIKSEIAKCDLVCANCHRIRTYKRLHAQIAK